MGGGGRYENLAGHFTDQAFPGVGGSIGLSRLFYVLNENNLLDKKTAKPIDYAILPLSENEFEYSFEQINPIITRMSFITSEQI